MVLFGWLVVALVDCVLVLGFVLYGLFIVVLIGCVFAFGAGSLFGLLRCVECL